MIITVHVGLQPTSVYVYICNHCFPGPELKYFTKTLIYIIQDSHWVIYADKD